MALSVPWDIICCIPNYIDNPLDLSAFCLLSKGFNEEFRHRFFSRMILNDNPIIKHPGTMTFESFYGLMSSIPGLSSFPRAISLHLSDEEETAEIVSRVVAALTGKNVAAIHLVSPDMHFLPTNLQEAVFSLFRNTRVSITASFLGIRGFPSDCLARVEHFIFDAQSELIPGQTLPPLTLKTLNIATPYSVLYREISSHQLGRLTHLVIKFEPGAAAFEHLSNLLLAANALELLTIEYQVENHALTRASTVLESFMEAIQQGTEHSRPTISLEWRFLGEIRSTGVFKKVILSMASLSSWRIIAFQVAIGNGLEVIRYAHQKLAKIQCIRVDEIHSWSDDTVPRFDHRSLYVLHDTSFQLGPRRTYEDECAYIKPNWTFFGGEKEHVFGDKWVREEEWAQVLVYVH